MIIAQIYMYCFSLKLLTFSNMMGFWCKLLKYKNVSEMLIFMENECMKKQNKIKSLRNYAHNLSDNKHVWIKIYQKFNNSNEGYHIKIFLLFSYSLLITIAYILIPLSFLYIYLSHIFSLNFDGLNMSWNKCTIAWWEKEVYVFFTIAKLLSPFIQFVSIFVNWMFYWLFFLIHFISICCQNQGTRRKPTNHMFSTPHENVLHMIHLFFQHGIKGKITHPDKRPHWLDHSLGHFEVSIIVETQIFFGFMHFSDIFLAPKILGEKHLDLCIILTYFVE